jgi:hypothetical protein
MKYKLFFSTLISLGCLLGSELPGSAQSWTWSGAPTNQSWKSFASSADGTRLVAVTSALTTPPTPGSIYVSTNSGATWFRAVASSDVSWRAVACSADGTRMFAASSGVIGASSAPIFASADAGLTWTLTSAPSNSWQSIVSSADGTQLAAVANPNGKTAGVYTSTNSGGTWALTSAPITNWAAIASSADGTKLAAAVQGGSAIDSSGHLITWLGLIYTSTNSGVTWQTTSAPGTSWFALASSADGTRLAAIAVGGLIYTSTNSGATWRPTSAPSSAWTAIASSADGRRLVAGADSSPGPIYVSQDSGATWIPHTVPGGSFWFAAASSADGNLLLAGGFNGGIALSRSTPSPMLRIGAAYGHLSLCWPVPSATFVLQSSTTWGTGWTDVSASSLMNFTNLNYEVVVPATNSASFYRLEKR